MLILLRKESRTGTVRLFVDEADVTLPVVRKHLLKHLPAELTLALDIVRCECYTREAL